MVVNLNFDFDTIALSPVISFTDTQAIVSFCARFELSTFDKPSLVESALNWKIAVTVKLSGAGMGITGIVEDEEENYAVISYLCNDNNERLMSSEITPKSQGGRIRVCVETDDFTAGFGATLRSITTFKLNRGDVTQQVVTKKAVVVDPLSTRLDCDPGQEVCSVECTIGNEFFYSNGVLTASGTVELQYRYSGIRHLIQMPVELPSVLSSPRQQQERKAIEAGGYIGERDFSLEVEVNPSSEQFTAEAFLCTRSNEVAKNPERKRFGDTVRICVRPNAAARERGVFVRGINSFFFQVGNKVQFAVETGGKVADDGNTMLICRRGNDLCVFSTLLTEDFFEENGEITGEGEIYLQFGREGQPTLTDLTSSVGRQLQEVITNSDAAFAGTTTVEVSIPVSTEEKEEEGDFGDDAKNWWVATPLFMKILYMVGVSVLLSIIASCCFGGYCSPKKRNKSTVNNNNGAEAASPVVVQVYVDGKSEDGDDGDSELRDSISKSTRQSMAKTESGRPVSSVGIPDSFSDSASSLGYSHRPEQRRSVPANVVPPHGTPKAQRQSIATTPRSARRSVGGSMTPSQIGSRRSMGMPTPQSSRRSIGAPPISPGARRPSSKSPGPHRRSMGMPTTQGSRRSIGAPPISPGARRPSSKSPGPHRRSMPKGQSQSMRDLNRTPVGRKSKLTLEQSEMKRLSKTPTGRRSTAMLEQSEMKRLSKTPGPGRSSDASFGQTGSTRTPAGGRRATLNSSHSRASSKGTRSSTTGPKSKVGESTGGLPETPF
jgi:hypothetical protein